MLLAEYKNGNYTVQIMSDGTKIRTHNGSPEPEFPESIDLKITDYCDAGCAWCHEMSTVRGKHAEFDTIMNVVKGLPAGTEIAIGGGNPLDHPQLDEILIAFKNQGLIANITVNGVHLMPYRDQINRLRAAKLYHGLGVSFTCAVRMLLLNPHLLNEERDGESSFLNDANVVHHFIAGVDCPEYARKLARPCKILILGYKTFGRGVKYNKTHEEKVQQNLEHWRFWLSTMLRRKNMIVSFDNLALSQLDVKSIVPEEVWQQHFMGEDGQFTMYVDAVRNEFAVSSTSTRKPRGVLNIREIFNDVRGQKV